MKTIFLFGHRECPTTVWEPVYEEAEKLIKEFPDEKMRFIVGHRGKFDYGASLALDFLKRKYPQIINLTLIAYYDPHEPNKKYCYLDGFDGTYYPEGLELVPKPFAIVRANNMMVDACDAVICYVLREGSNTYKLLRRARRRGIPVANVYGKCRIYKKDL